MNTAGPLSWHRKGAIPLLLSSLALLATGCPQSSERSGSTAEGAPAQAAPWRFVPPLNDAAAGEELTMRRGVTTWRWRVVSVDDENVAVEVQEYLNDAPNGGLQLFQWPRNGYGLPPGFVVREIYRDYVQVDGRGWDCTCLRVSNGRALRWYWLSDEIPVHGVLRIAVDVQGKGAPDLMHPVDYVAPSK